MVLALPLIAGLAVAPLLGGSLRALGSLGLRSLWLFYAAIAVQLVAFPVEALPWRTPPDVASALWLVSYGLLIAAAVRNRRIPGVPVVAAGMLANVVAVAANGGRMPVLPDAMRAAGHDYGVHQNSEALADPRLSWLVDRWAAPDWVPLANVYSVGDVLIAFGGLAFAFGATGVLAHLRRRARLRLGR